MKNMGTILVFTGLFALAIPISSQETYTFGNIKLYEAVVNRLFEYDPTGVTTKVELRYMMCDSGEMQVLIREGKGDKLDLEVWNLPPASKTIWDQLGRLVVEHPLWDAEHLASSIVLHHDSFTIERSSMLGELLENDRPRQTTLIGDNGIALDGSEYELYIISISKKINLSLSGPQNAALSADPIIRWMGQVRNQIEHRVMQRNGSPGLSR